LNYGYRDDLTSRVENLSHPDLSAEYSNYHHSCLFLRRRREVPA
jgi:hypothetical protein